MALDFNVDPFFDDYSEDKKFYKILFRPGYAVQARELTQLQTILQQQIKRNGDHIFKNGAMVIPGQVAYDTDVYYVKIASKIEDATTAFDTLISVDFAALKGNIIKNAAGLQAKVIDFSLYEDGNNPHTIFVKYLNTVQDSGENITEFEVGDILTVVDNTIAAAPINVLDTVAPAGLCASASIKRGVYYINDNFVLVDDQTIILDKYNHITSAKIGLLLNESVVYPEEDESLLDNALGSPNYAAPGAARHFMDLVLTKLSLNSADPAGFIELLRLDNGKTIFKVDRTAYAEIEKTLARRTYDESGDYALNPFSIIPRHYRNNFRGEWAPNEKYIQGDVIKAKLNPSSADFYYFTATEAGQSGPGPSTPAWSSYEIADSISDNQVTWEHTYIPNLNQGVYTFDSGDADYEDFTLDDHVRLDGMLAIGVEAGKAYVRGYEIVKLSTEYNISYKSRDLPASSKYLADYLNASAEERIDGDIANGLPAITTPVSVSKTVNIDTSMGSYVLVKDVAYTPDLTNFSRVNLYSAAAGAGSIIGTARVRGFEYHDTISATRVYKLFLFDIQTQSGYSFNEVLSIGKTGTGQFLTNTYNTVSGSTELLEPEKNSLVFDLPDYAVKQVSEVDYYVVAPFTVTSDAGSFTITAPTGYTFEPTAVNTNYVVFAGADVAVVAGTILYGTAVSLALSNNNTTLTISTNDHTIASGKSYTVFATLKRSNSTTALSSISITDYEQVISDSGVGRAHTITLAKPNVTRIVSIKMASDWVSTNYTTNITNRYTFDSGQTGASMDKCTLSLQDGAPAPTGAIQIKFEYMDISSSSDGNLLAVNSYIGANSKMRYDQIGTVGFQLLRDSIDFRPYAAASDYTQRFMPKYGETTTIKYTNYLPRVDNISLSSAGRYIIRQGIPSATPAEPSLPADSMKLGVISLEPYTFDVDSYSVGIKRSENKRYTMRDIGKLEKRISDLEYYTALSLTEMDTKNLKVLDSNGLERYKNGFLVDQFDGQGVGNASSPDWNASIDSEKKELRPFFSQNQVNLLENRGKTTKNYKISGDLVTLPYTEVVDSNMEQTKASISESVNPYDLYTYTGTLSLTPWSDTWFSTEQRPDIIVNDQSQYEALVSKAEADGVLGTVWASWQTLSTGKVDVKSSLETLDRWSSANTTVMNASNNGGSFWRARSTFTADELEQIGIPGSLAGNQSALGSFSGGLRVLTIETSAVQTTKQRSGVNTFIVDKVDSRVLEDRVVDTHVVPYIRPRALLIRGGGYRPSTRLYNFFDGVSVDEYVTPAAVMKFTQVTNYHSVFTTEKNCGSNVQNAERLVNYNTGLYVNGTVTVTNGSTEVVGIGTSFTTEIAAGDIIFIGDDDYTVASLDVTTPNNKLYLTQTYQGSTAEEISITVKGAKHSNLEVEMAFSHGEVIKEYVGGTATGRSAIVISQETDGIDRYVYVLNIKGDTKFSTNANSYWEGEYTDYNGAKPRIKYVENSYVQPSTLISSYTGMVAGVFRIPSNPIKRFKTGRRQYRLSSDPSNNPNKEISRGESYYEATGLVEIRQRTILSTRTAEIASEIVDSGVNTFTSSPQRNVIDDSGWFDPLAQTFLVQKDGGIFVTSVDLYFQAKDTAVPVKIEIREVVNGYPGKIVLPFSRLQKAPAGVAVDALKGEIATNFKFVSPVYLQNGVEYALVVMSDSAKWRLWISQTNTIDVVSDNIITQQPHQGVLFKSQNASTWTADQTQDLKFKIYRAEFSSTTADIEFIPPNNGLQNLSFNPLSFLENSTRMRVQQISHGFKVNDLVTFTNRQITTFVNGIPVAYLFNTPLNIEKVELDSYVVNLYSTLPKSNSSLTIGTGSKTFTMSANFDKLKFDLYNSGSTKIRFTRDDNGAADSRYWMEGTITSVTNTTVVVNITDVGGTGTYSSWILSSTSAGVVGGAYISATRNYQYQLANMTANTNVLPGTNITYNMKSLDLDEQPKYNPLTLKENIDIKEERILPSAENYSPASLPLVVTATLTTTQSNLSPVIDLHGIAMTLVNNKIDRVNAGINISDLDDSLILNSITMASSGEDLVLTVDGTTSTVSVNASVDSGALYNALNRLRVGNTCKFIYSDVTGANYQTVTAKYYDDAGNIYVEFVPEIDPTTGIYDAALQPAADPISVDLYLMNRFISEFAPYGSSTKSKYVTKKITFARPSDMVKVMFSAIIPYEADVEVYYKTGLASDALFETARYYKAEPTLGYTKNDTDFKDMEFDVEGLPLYDCLMVKIVMKSSDKSKAPRIRDLRIIGCAA